MSNFFPLNQASRAVLLRLINLANSLDLPPNFMSLGTPRTLTPPEQAEHGYNTEVVLTANPGATHVGQRAVYYDRLDIGEVFKRYAKVPVAAPFENSIEALTQINSLYGLEIDPSEIVGIMAIDYSVRITIRDSYLWKPGSFIEVGVNVDEAELARIENFTNRIWQYTNFDFPAIITLPLGDFQ